MRIAQIDVGAPMERPFAPEEKHDEGKHGRYRKELLCNAQIGPLAGGNKRNLLGAAMQWNMQEGRKSLRK